MNTKNHRINLTQKRKAQDGQWQFYPVQWDGNKPDPRFIIQIAVNERHLTCPMKECVRTISGASAISLWESERLRIVKQGRIQS